MKPIKESPTKTRRKFDTTFKREAVGNWLCSGKSAAVVAKELGLTEGLLFAWRKLLPPPTTLGGEIIVVEHGVRTATCANNARSEVFDFIEVFYNRQRRHTSLGGLSPAQFELKNN